MAERRWVLPGHTTEKPRTLNTDEVRLMAYRMGHVARLVTTYPSRSNMSGEQPAMMVGPFVFVGLPETAK